MTSHEIGKMDDSLSFSKKKMYLLSFACVDQLQEKRHLPVKKNKERSFPGPATYASSITIKINPYIRNIKPADFCKCLEQAKQFFKCKWNEEVDEINLHQTRRHIPSSLRGHGDLLEKMNAPRRRKSSNCARERPEYAQEACRRKFREERAETPEKNQIQKSWLNEGQGTPRTRQVRANEIRKETEAQQTRLNLKRPISDKSWEASERRNQRCWTMHLLKIKGPRVGAQGAGWWTTTW